MVPIAYSLLGPYAHCTRILQEPSPLMLGAAHLTMKDHFDVDELLQHLISTTGNKGKTRVRLLHPTRMC